MAKIMVVDDEATLANILGEVLTAEGHTVYIESDGLKALGRMLEIQPDVVLSDVMMPEMGGAPLLTAMRDNAYLGETPVIIMSALPEALVLESCRGFSAFLQKPFQMSEVLDAVNSAVKRTS
jgi:two-component system chemotaxis response regulator CheY